MHEDFVNLANMLKNEYLLKTEDLFVCNKHAWFAAFAEHFKIMCVEIVKLQGASLLHDISYLEYTMLYTNFINRRYVTEVLVYDGKRYLDKNQRIIGEYDISFLFIYFDELWNRLLTVRKRYVGKISAWEVTAFMLQALPDFYSYLINVARFAITDCIDKNPFANIIKNEMFKVKVGGYMANTETIFTACKTKDAEALAKWFEERLENKYTFEDYSSLDFSGRSFTYTEFRYSQFRYSNLNNVSFDGSVLIGASFYNAHMEKCRFDFCDIYEADFSYAILKSASFALAHGRAGLPNEKEWRHVGFLPVRFRYADLTNADFRWADLTGADFTGAVLTNADFTNAILDGAIFDGSIGRRN